MNRKVPNFDPPWNRLDACPQTKLAGHILCLLALGFDFLRAHNHLLTALVFDDD